MKKLNSKGFAHHAAVLALLVIGVIGGIGSYIYLNKSSAYLPTPDGGNITATKSGCLRVGGVWLSRTDINTHGPCYTVPGAYFINVGKGTVKEGVSDVKHYTKGRSPSMEYPNYVVVVSGKWKVWDDQYLRSDIRTNEVFTHSKSDGVYNLCKPRDSYSKLPGGKSYWSDYVYCSKSDIYIESE